jgi:exonuclease III
VDHAFVPAAWLPKIRRFELGDPDQWLRDSDHVPLIVELEGDLRG